MPGRAMQSLETVAALLAASLVAAACAHSDVRQHAAVDPDAKTISMPPPKRGLLKGIGNALKADGWKIAADQGAAAPKKAKLTSSAAGSTPDADRERATERKADESSARPSLMRYRLTATFRQIERCRSGGPLYIYEIMLVDNRGGGKVLEQSGRDCERDIVEKFAEALRAKAK